MSTNNSANIKSAGITGYNGSGTFVGTPVTQHNLLVGGATTDTIVNIPPSSTVGFVLTSNGSSSDPSFQTVSPGANVTFTGDTGTPFSTSAVTIFANTISNTSGSSVRFNASTPDMTLNLSDINNNTNIGLNSGNATLSGGTGGTGNVGVGVSTLSSLTTTDNNTVVGQGAGSSVITGSGNCLYGNSAGQSYNGSESYNIVVGINGGTNGESNVLRIGGGTGTGSFQQNLAFISGVTASIPIDANSPQVVLCDNTDNITVVPDTTAGFVLTSNSPNAPTFQASTGSAVTFTNESTGFTATVNNGYFCNASLVATLPASPSQGNFVEIITLNNAIVTIQANTGQTIRLLTSASSSAGSATNVSNGSSIKLIYRANDTQWFASYVVGSWTLV
jgi:hypothetical protein